MDIDNFPLTYEFLDETGFELVEGIVEGLQRDRKNASYALRDNMDYDIQKVGDDLIIYITYADHGSNVLSGRKGGQYKHTKGKGYTITGVKWPPIKSIKKWIRQKGISPVARLGKIPTIDQLSYLISRSIAKNSIYPYNFLEPAERFLNSKEFLDEYNRHMIDDIENDVMNYNKK